MNNLIDRAFIERVENDHFRTDEDTGANTNAMLIWNQVRRHAGLSELSKEALPAYCVTHDAYHFIREAYGCKRKSPTPKP